jgi:hypothetical protein
MPTTENLRYAIEVFDERDNLVEVLRRLADLPVAHAVFEAAVAKYPAMRICIRDLARVSSASMSHSRSQ